MPAPRLLIFDLDGTLIDSSVDICNAVNATLTHFGRPALPHDVIASYIGDGAATLLHRAFGQRDEPAPDDVAPRDALSYFIRFYRMHKLDNTALYDGVREALAALHTAWPEASMAVLTNKPVGPSREICRLLDIEQFFFQNYGGDSFATKKPDPEGFRRLIAEAESLPLQHSRGPIDASEVVMIGDSAVDVLTARACGASTIGCLFGIHPEALLEAKPDYLASHASEWPGLLDRLARD